MKTLLLTAFLFTVNAASSASPLGNRPSFSHLFENELQTVGAVLDIEQDKLGFVWIAGKGGLARYDGYRFHFYTVDNDKPGALTESVIQDIHEDSHGELWFATEGGGLLRLNRELDNFYVYPSQTGDNTSVPHHRLYSINEDSSGGLWITALEGGVSLYNRERDEFERFLQHSPVGQVPILDFLEFKKNNYLIATEGYGVYHWNKEVDSLVRYSGHDGEEQTLAHNLVRVLFKDSQGRIWIGSDSGLDQFIPENKTFKHIDLPSIYDTGYTAIWHIEEDRNGTLWLGSDGVGLTYFHPDSNTLGNYDFDARNKDGIACSAVRSVMVDKIGDLWVGCFPEGVDHFDHSNRLFESHKDFIVGGEHDSAIWAFSEDDQGRVWMGTGHTGLYIFDLATREISNQFKGEVLSELNLPNAVLSLYRDSEGMLWIGSWGEGLFAFNPENLEINRYIGSVHEDGFDGFSVWRMTEDNRGNLWIATTNNGVIRFNRKEAKFYTYKTRYNDNTSVNHNTVWSVYFAPRANELWVATNAGAARYDPESDAFVQYKHDPNNSASISHDWVQEIYEDSEGMLWFLTHGGGLNLYDPASSQFTKINIGDDYASEKLTGIIEDNNGVFWISSDNGITRFNKEEFSSIHFSRKNWLQSNFFYRGAYLKLRSSELIFGGSKGFSIFSPSDLNYNQYSAPTYITALRFYDESYKVGERDSPISKDILVSDKVILPNTLNAFTLEFTSLNYRVHSDNQYQYYLKGFDKGFLPPTKTNSATYTNLDPGTYTFIVRASNNSGIWGSEIDQLEIVVLASPWLSWWAKTVYLSTFIAIFVGFIIYQRRRILYERELNENFRRLDNLKDEILENTSRELKNPLHGIVGIAEILQNSKLGVNPDDDNYNLSLISSSAKRLAGLVNDIHDFSKLRSGDLTLNRELLDLKRIVNLVVVQSMPLIDSDYVELIDDVPEGLPGVFADEARVQQVLANILNNAIKHTKVGQIRIEASYDDMQACLCVCDSGVGISEYSKKKLLDSFDKLNEVYFSSERSAGLGLTLSKKLIELQQGHLSIESDIGRGSKFSIYLPLYNASKKGVKTVNEEVREFSEGFASARRSRLGKISNEPENELIHYKNYILVYNPYPEFSDSLSLGVNKLGFKADFYNDCKRAYDALMHNTNYQSVILCVRSDHPYALRFCEQIRKHKSIVELPIVFFSNKSETDFLVSAYRAGASDFVNFNHNLQELLLRVQIATNMLQQINQTHPFKIKRSHNEAIIYDCAEYFPAPKSKGYTLLIVDDEKANRTILRHLLNRCGYNVYETCSGDRALSCIAQRFPIDMVLLDQRMPTVSGFEICKEIRNTFSAAELPVLLLSSAARWQDLQKAFSVGANDVIERPVKRPEFELRIEAFSQIVGFARNETNKQTGQLSRDFTSRSET